MNDLPAEQHLSALRDLHADSKEQEEICLRFKEQHIEDVALPNVLRPLMDDIYATARSQLLDYKDISNFVPRLERFVGTSAISRMRRGFLVFVVVAVLGAAAWIVSG